MRLRKPLLCKDSLEEFDVVDFRLLVSSNIQMTLDADLLTFFLEQATKAGVMDAITLDHGHWRGLAVSYPDRRIILGNVSDGRTLD